MVTDTYHHTQRGPWGLMLYGLAVVFFVVAWYAPVAAMQVVFLATGLFMLPLGMAMGRLTVSDEGSHLSVSFGPLPLFRTSIRYGDIVEVETTRTTLLDGWGIHWVPRRGWVWNIWGYDCVRVRSNGSTLRIGTDDPDGLAALLNSRISPQNA